MSSKFKIQNSKFKNKIFFLCLSALAFSLSACSGNPPTNVQTNNANTQTTNTNPPVVSSHSGDYPKPQNNNTTNTGSMGGGSPIDTSQYDANIKKAEAKYNKNKDDNTAKTELAQAYFDRGLALTDSKARQYRAALGDFRKTLKYNPDHEEAKMWIERIVSIFQQMNREAPKEGEEPPPLPYKKS